MFPRSIVALALLLLLLLGACDTRPPTAEPTEPIPTSAKENAQPADTSTNDISDAAPDCVAQCVHRNQMRAVAADQIEADCKRECGVTP